MTAHRHSRRFDATNRYGLVILLIVVTYAVSAATSKRAFTAVVVIEQLATVWLVFSVSESRRAQRLAGIAIVVVAGMALLGAVAGAVVTERAGGLDVAFSFVSSLLYLVAPVVILRHLIRRPVIDMQTLAGAVASYLLIGMMFAFVFRTLGTLQTSPPFFGDSGPGSMSDDLFFSFVTLTTTGYGNLVPAANPGQSLAVCEAIVGQLFLVTAVAKIVSDFGGRGRPPGGDSNTGWH